MNRDQQEQNKGLTLRNLYPDDAGLPVRRRVRTPSTQPGFNTLEAAIRNQDRYRVDKHCMIRRALYRYTERDGVLLAAVARYKKPTNDRQAKFEKRFVQLSEGDGKWIARSSKKPWPRYRLAMLNFDETIVIVEGEKAADMAALCGLNATTSSSGGAAHKTDWTPLAGCDAVLVADNDSAGLKYAARFT